MEALAALSVATSIVQFVDFGSKLLSKYRKLYRSSNGVLSETVDVEVITTDLMTLVQGLKRKLPENRPLSQVASGTSEQSEDSEALDRLCTRCVEIGNEILKRLESIGAVKDNPREEKRCDGQQGKYTGKQAEDEERTATLPEPTSSQRAGRPRNTQHILDSSKAVEGPKSRLFKKWEAFRKAFRNVWDEKEIEALSATLHEFRTEIEFRILVSFRGALNSLASQQLHASHQLGRSTRLILDHFLNDRDQLVHQLRAQAERLLEIQEGQARRETLYTQHIEDYFMGRLGPVGSLQSPRGPKNLDSSEVEGYTGDPRVEEEIRHLVVENGILESLSFVTLTDRRESLEVPYHQTFEWIYGEHACPLQNQFSNFGDWLRQGSGIFWINGKVGSGKSTLMRYIYDNDKTRRGLEHWAGSIPSETYAFFFWNTGDDDQKSQRGLLRSLLFEILQGHRDLLSEVMPDAWDAWNSRASGVVSRRIPMDPCFLSQELYPWTMIRLKRALRVLLDILQQKVKICLLIDGLDEYEGDYLDVVDLVQEYARSPNIKLCLSSRPLLVFEQAFDQLPYLRLQDLTHADISHYVKSRLHSHRYMVQISLQHPAAVAGLISEIVSKARGVFLWVKLVVRSLLRGLCDYNRISDLKKRVDCLPEDLEALYAHILKTIDPFYHEQASQIFQMVRAAQEISPGHLTLLTLSWADDEDETLAEEARIRPLNNEEISTRCRMMDSRLKSVCAGLLESNDVRFSDITPDSKVMFLHRTVSDWLAKRELWGELVSRTSGTGFSPNLSMLRSCVLNLKSMDVGPNNPLDMTFIMSALRYAKGAEADLGTAFPKLLDQLDIAASHQWRVGKSNVVYRRDWSGSNSEGSRWESSPPPRLRISRKISFLSKSPNPAEKASVELHFGSAEHFNYDFKDDDEDDEFEDAVSSFRDALDSMSKSVALPPGHDSKMFTRTGDDHTTTSMGAQLDESMLHHWSYGIEIPGIKPMGKASTFYHIAIDMGLSHYAATKYNSGKIVDQDVNQHLLMQAISPTSRMWDGTSRGPDPELVETTLQSGADPNLLHGDITPWQRAMQAAVCDLTTLYNRSIPRTGPLNYQMGGAAKAWARIFEVFISHGADPSVRTRRHPELSCQPGLSPLDIVERYFPELLQNEASKLKLLSNGCNGEEIHGGIDGEKNGESTFDIGEEQTRAISALVWVMSWFKI